MMYAAHAPTSRITSVRASPWTLLTTTDQASDTPSDPGTFLTSGTLSAGTFTWVMAGDTTQYDGYNENWPGWTRSLVALYPDFDPAKDMLDLGLVIAAMPLATHKYGLWCGVSDAAVASRATFNVGGVTVFPNSTTVTAAGVLGATSTTSATNGSNTNPPTKMLVRLWWSTETAPAVRTTGATRRTTDDLQITSVANPGAAFASATPTDWRVCIGVAHHSTTTGTPTLSAQLYHRRIRTQGAFP